MRVLITGAAGFLGRHFLRHHMEHDADVVGVDNLSGKTDYPTDLLESEVLVIDDAEHWMKEVDGHFDIAYHFAAPVGGREKIERDPLYNADSLRLDAAFFRWATRHPGTLCVYPSSSAVYGTSLQAKSDSQSLSETMFKPDSSSWWAPDEMYGFTKMAGEYLAWKSARYDIDTLVIRPFSGYGEGQSFEYPVPSIAARALRREDPLMVWGSGKQQRDFIHVDDIVRITTLRLGYPVKGYDTLNLGSGWAISFKQVAEICAEIVGYKPQIITDETKPQGVARRWSDVNKMEVFYSPTQLIPLREGLERVLADVEQRAEKVAA